MNESGEAYDKERAYEVHQSDIRIGQKVNSQIRLFLEGKISLKGFLRKMVELDEELEGAKV